MKAITGIVIIAIIALIAGFVPIIEVPYTETVQYLDTETYYESAPDIYTYKYLEEVPAGPNDLITGYSPSHGYIFTYEEREGIGATHKRVERERVVIKERLETHYKKVPIFEYLLSKFQG